MPSPELRALIVDDEGLARRGLEIRLGAISDLEVCGHARNGREALTAVAELKPDIVFLDIQMPGMDGFDVLKGIAGPDMPLVIFVTAYSEYAIRAFEANALDYLLKPVSKKRFARNLLSGVDFLPRLALRKSDRSGLASRDF